MPGRQSISGEVLARHVMLNNVAHKDLRVIARHGAEFGDNLGTVLTFPTEYGDVQREYPIFFRKDRADRRVPIHRPARLPTGRESVPGSRTAGMPAYIPGIVARGPFLIGFQNQDVDGELRREPVIHVDLDSPRVSTTEGEPVFLPHGGNTRYLDRIGTILQGIHQGLARQQSHVRCLHRARTDRAGERRGQVQCRRAIQSARPVHHQRREAARAERRGACFELNSAGFLQGAFLVIASLNNMKKLIDMKHRRRRELAGVAAAS